MMKLQDLRVDRARLWASIEGLAALTDPAQPSTRRSFSALFEQGRRWLMREMTAAGLSVHVDAGGNLVGRLAGRRPYLPALVTGSHSDTVPSGGRFDGVLGVLSGIEVARTLAASGLQLNHSLEVVDFLAEEPSEYGVSCVGSRAWAGLLSADMLEAKAPDGECLADGLRRLGGDPGTLGAALRTSGELAAFVELHIEQGPVLESEGLPIGVVTSIVGIRRWRFVVVGRPDHAGTTPMTLRRDALVGAARIIDAIAAAANNVTPAEGYFVATVGRIEVQPNAVNAVPGRAEFVLEMRSDRDALLNAMWTRIQGLARGIVDTLDLKLEAHPLTSGSPAQCHEPVMRAIESVCDRLRFGRRRMVSGAGHDAVYLSRLCPTGMIFIPCLNGRSHCPEEWASLQQTGDGADVLLQTLIELDHLGV